MSRLLLIVIPLLISLQGYAQHSVSRQWNEVLLGAIRNDYARPTVDARNLFQGSTLMYDLWAVYEPTAQTYLLGKNLNGYSYPFNGISIPENIKSAQEEDISYACYRLFTKRFENSPSAAESQGSLTM